MIHQDCVDRVMKLGEAESIRRGFVDMFHAMSNDAEMQGVPNATLSMVFYDEQCSLKPGDWAAELHLLVRKVKDETADSSSGEQVDGEGTEEGKA